ERANLPAPIAPTRRVGIWRTPYALERTAAIKELRPAGAAKFRPRMRLTGADKFGARMRRTGADKLSARMRITRSDKFRAWMRPARPHKLSARMRAATGIDDLRSRRHAGVRPARRNERLGRRR